MGRHKTTHVEANTVSILQRQEDHSAILTDLQHMTRLKSDVNDGADNLDKPIWMVPIGRNPDFVGRKPVIQEIEMRLSPKQDIVPKAVLCGLGGVG